MNQLEIIEPYSPEWFQVRLGKFTASKISKLITGTKATREKYIYEKASEIMTGQSPKETFSQATDWGHANELEALQCTANTLNINIEPGTWVQFNDDLGCTPDGSNDTHIIQIKCPYNSDNHLVNLMLADPAALKKKHDEYYWQIVCETVFCKKEAGLFVSFDPRMRVKEQRLKIIQVIPTAEERQLLLFECEKAVRELKAILLLFPQPESCTITQ